MVIKEIRKESITTFSDNEAPIISSMDTIIYEIDGEIFHFINTTTLQKIGDAPLSWLSQQEST